MGEICLADEFILETHGLTKEFAGFFAVRDVSLKVRKGSIHALIGPNGAGKTTCFNLLTNFLQPTAGNMQANRLQQWRNANETSHDDNGARRCSRRRRGPRRRQWSKSAY